MTDRPFVLVPLLDIDPDLVHPGSLKRLSYYLSEEEKNRLILYKELDLNHVGT
jgi:7,8-dihydro-6-hydroxymethylpterin-pyrophosphokinase